MFYRAVYQTINKPSLSFLINKVVFQSIILTVVNMFGEQGCLAKIGSRGCLYKLFQESNSLITKAVFEKTQ